MSYRIVTDSCCDLPEAMYAQLGLSMIPLTLNFRGAEHADLSEPFMKDMYAGMRAGETASTAAVNPDGWASIMEPILAAGEDVLVMAFSSGLSTTYQSAVIAANDLQEKYPDRKINVVDTLCASLGQGLLVWYAAQKAKTMTLEELTAWCEAHKLNLCHWFTVDDLMFLKRGGRVSATTALVGTMLAIKPVLHVDNEGRLINVGKARGRKPSLMTLVNEMEKRAIDPQNQTIFISHGDCEDDVQIVADEIRKRFGVKTIHINYVGPVIGSHTGAGVVALFFVGKER